MILLSDNGGNGDKVQNKEEKPPQVTPPAVPTPPTVPAQSQQPLDDDPQAEVQSPEYARHRGDGLHHAVLFQQIESNQHN